jgi:radical SAM protein with 4Fe4S-binding SPASM domain
VLRFVPQGRGLDHRRELELDTREEHAFVSELVRLRRRSSVEIRTGSPFNGIVPGNAVPCRAGELKLVIQGDGNVLPCEVYKHKEARDWGLSVLRSSLTEILESPVLRELRRGIREMGCLRCPVHSVLPSGSGEDENGEQVDRAPLRARAG